MRETGLLSSAIQSPWTFWLCSQCTTRFFGEAFSIRLMRSLSKLASKLIMANLQGIWWACASWPFKTCSWIWWWVKSCRFHKPSQWWREKSQIICTRSQRGGCPLSWSQFALLSSTHSCWHCVRYGSTDSNTCHLKASVNGGESWLLSHWQVLNSAWCWVVSCHSIMSRKSLANFSLTCLEWAQVSWIIREDQISPSNFCPGFHRCTTLVNFYSEESWLAGNNSFKMKFWASLALTLPHGNPCLFSSECGLATS